MCRACLAQSATHPPKRLSGKRIRVQIQRCGLHFIQLGRRLKMSRYFLQMAFVLLGPFLQRCLPKLCSAFRKIKIQVEVSKWCGESRPQTSQNFNYTTPITPMRRYRTIRVETTSLEVDQRWVRSFKLHMFGVWGGSCLRLTRPVCLCEMKPQI